MPKKRGYNNSYMTRKPRIPNYRNDEIMGVVVEIYGGDHMLVKGENGTLYLGLIRGKIRKRLWTRVGDVVLLMPWLFETKREGKKPKAHIIWRYTRTQTNWLTNHRYIKRDFLEEIQNI